MPQAEAALSKDTLMASVRMMMKLSHFQELVDLVAQNRALADADVEVLMAEATATRKLEKLTESYQALDKAVQIDPNRPDALERMIMLCRPMRMRKEARALMQRHETAFPDRTDFREKLTWV